MRMLAKHQTWGTIAPLAISTTALLLITAITIYYPVVALALLLLPIIIAIPWAFHMHHGIQSARRNPNRSPEMLTKLAKLRESMEDNDAISAEIEAANEEARHLEEEAVA